MNAQEKARNVFESALKVVVALALVAMVVSIAIQVISRYVFGAPTTWTTEFSAFMLVYITFFGTYLSTKRGQHFRIDIVRERLARTRVGVVIDGAVKLAEIAFLVFVVVYSIPVFIELFALTAVAVRIPMSLVAVAVPLGLLGMALRLAWELWKSATAGDGEVRKAERG